MIRWILPTALALFTASTLAFAEEKRPSEESIRQLMKVTEVEKLLEGVLVQVDQTFKATLEQAAASHGPVSPQRQEIVDKVYEKSTAILKEELTWQSLEPMYIKIYQDSFTQEEVDGLLAFYQTPAGQALIKKMPLVVQNTMVEVQKRMASMMERMESLQSEVAKELSEDKPSEDKPKKPAKKGKSSL